MKIVQEVCPPERLRELTGVECQLTRRQQFARCFRPPATLLYLCYPALTAALLHAALLAVYVAAFGDDLSALACVGSQFAGTFPYEHVHTAFERNGYDGQFYYAIARAPFARHTAGFARLPKGQSVRAEGPNAVGVDNIVDNPCRRQLRLLYPLVCWALTAGDPVLLFWAMPLVNLLAIGGLAWLGALFATRQGFSPWWGVLLPLAVNAGLPALRDLTDVVSLCMVAALLVAWLLRGPWWTLVLCGAAALFSREQNAAVLAAVFVCAAGERRWRVCVGFLAVLALWLCWVAWLWQMYQHTPFVQRQGNFDWPLLGLLASQKQMRHDWLNELRTAFCLLLLAFQGVLALDLLRRPSVDAALRLVALSVLGLALVGGVEIYRDTWSFGRAYAGLPLVVWLGCVQTRRLWPLGPLSAYVLLQWATVLKAIVAVPQ